MALTRTQTLFGFLARFEPNGSLRGAQVDYLETIADGDTVVAVRQLDPVPITPDNIAALDAVFSSLNAAALARTTDLQTKLAAAQEAAASVPALQQQIADLTAQLNPPANPRILTRDEFYTNRFQQAERIAILTAVTGNPAVQDWINQLLAAESVNLDDARTQQGIGYLVQQGLLTQDRATQILS